MLLVRLAAWGLAFGASLLFSAPALAVYETRPDWIPNRHAGAPMEEDPPLPPHGWFGGPALSSPYSLGATVGYLALGTPLTWKWGASWGFHTDKGLTMNQWADGRLFASLVYSLVPQAVGGPYVETGLGVVRSSGDARALNWPMLPHLAFGTTGRFSSTLGWDVNFSASANGVLGLSACLLFEGPLKTLVPTIDPNAEPAWVP